MGLEKLKIENEETYDWYEGKYGIFLVAHDILGILELGIEIARASDVHGARLVVFRLAATSTKRA